MADRVLVLQSFSSPPWAAWRSLCIDSVKDWATAQGYDYRLIGDELFDPIPDDARRGCHGVKLPLTDLGRLLWMRDLLGDGWSRVIWLDADVLIFDPAFRMVSEVVGREIWISRGTSTAYRASESVNNCALSFVSGSDRFNRCLDATLAAAAGFSVPPHPRALGPDLFRQLHAEQPFEVTSDLAMISPLMLAGLARGDTEPLRAHHSVWDGPVRAANLCGSMIEEEALALNAAEALLRDPGLMAPPGPPPTIERLDFG